MDFSVILQRRTLFWVHFPIFLFLKKIKIEQVYFAEKILWRSQLPPVHGDGFVPAVQVCGIGTWQRCFRMPRSHTVWDASNSITLNIQQQTASSSTESQGRKAPLMCCSHSLRFGLVLGGSVPWLLRGTAKALSALLTGMAVIIPPGQPPCKTVIIIIMKCPSGFPFNNWTHSSPCKLSW